MIQKVFCRKGSLRACFKTPRGSAARDFGRSQGGEERASPKGAVSSEPTKAPGKRPAEEPLGVLKHALRACLKNVAADVRRRKGAGHCPKNPPPYVGGYGLRQFSDTLLRNSRLEFIAQNELRHESRTRHLIEPLWKCCLRVIKFIGAGRGFGWMPEVPPLSKWQ